jgi:hypothetical protein
MVHIDDRIQISAESDIGGIKKSARTADSALQVWVVPVPRIVLVAVHVT